MVFAPDGSTGNDPDRILLINQLAYTVAVAAVMIGEFMIDYVLQGLFLGLMSQCVLVLSARRISKSYWPEVYLTILFLVKFEGFFFFT